MRSKVAQFGEKVARLATLPVPVFCKNNYRHQFHFNYYISYHLPAALPTWQLSRRIGLLFISLDAKFLWVVGFAHQIQMEPQKGQPVIHQNFAPNEIQSSPIRRESRQVGNSVTHTPKATLESQNSEGPEFDPSSGRKVLMGMSGALLVGELYLWGI